MKRRRIIWLAAISFGLIGGAVVCLTVPLSLRPVFCEWRAGELCYAWREVRFVDQLGVSVYIDRPLNAVFICVSIDSYGGDSFKLENGVLTLSTRRADNKYDVKFASPESGLYVGLADGTIARFAVDDRFAARIYEAFGRDTYPPSAAEVIAEQYNADDRSRLLRALDLLGWSDKRAQP